MTIAAKIAVTLNNASDFQNNGLYQTVT